MSEEERCQLTDKEAQKRLPYIKYLTKKAGYKRGNIKVVLDMPENYIDYLLIDEDNCRLGGLNMFNNGDCYTLEITVLNDKYEISLEYHFLISIELYTKILERMGSLYGDPELVNYNLQQANKFKVIKGGKSK